MTDSVSGYNQALVIIRDVTFEIIQKASRILNMASDNEEYNFKQFHYKVMA